MGVNVVWLLFFLDARRHGEESFARAEDQQRDSSASTVQLKRDRTKQLSSFGTSRAVSKGNQLTVVVQQDNCLRRGSVWDFSC